MKKLFRYMVAGIMVIAGTSVANAQFYEIANQLPGLIQPALIGGLNYKGYVEADFIKGVGNHNVDFLNFSTSQGFRYSNWFFMGVGIGVDVLFSNVKPLIEGMRPGVDYPSSQGKSSVTTAVMIPLFTDFRFNFGKARSTSFFADVKLGCSFLASNNYVEVDNGYLTSQQYFLFKPTLGVRIPINSRNAKQAVNVGVSYQLLTSNYWRSYNSNVTLNGLGVNVGYEW